MTPYPADLDRWRTAARISARARDLGVRSIAPGVERRAVADKIESFIRSQGAEPAFPANLSRNVEAAHYTPSIDDTVTFDEGDLVKVDVGAHIEGAIADTAETVEVGGTRKHENLKRAADEAVMAAIAQVRPGGAIDDVSRAIETTIHARGFRPIQDLTGHKIDRYLLHAHKSIPNVGGMTGERFEEGEIIAIEPFATNGIGHIDNGPFGNIQRFRRDPGSSDPVLARLFSRFRTLPFTARWCAEPAEQEALRRARKHLQLYPVFLERAGGIVAQAEHTILVGPNRAEILTARD